MKFVLILECVLTKRYFSTSSEGLRLEFLERELNKNGEDIKNSFELKKK